MPTFTGETGERIRNMEARLAALEAGGGIPPKTGVFSISHGFSDPTIIVPSGVTKSILLPNTEFDPFSWVTAGRDYKPQLDGYYRLNTILYCELTASGSDPTIQSDIIYLGIIKNNITRTLQTVYANSGGPIVLSGTTVLEANGFSDIFIPYIRHNCPGSLEISSYICKFEGELIGARY